MERISLRSATSDDVGAIQECLVAAYADAKRDIDDLPDVAGGISDDIKERQVLIAEDA
ncbi:hypothetical protein [Ruegeria sp. ANG-R]|uniref:hypothetical protein n=1 Tax=Ruegeria sp. ANG-R TaxID=1577903 RepID=UPI000A52A10C|nr:hypothetical protein [Ruegeria sp. ANG-R]